MKPLPLHLEYCNACGSINVSEAHMKRATTAYYVEV